MTARRLLAFLIVATVALWADSEARIVRLSHVAGQVEIDRVAGRGFEDAILNLPVVQGTRLQAGERGEAEVEFENGSTVRLAPESEVSFHELALLGNGGKVNAVEIDRGLVYLNFRVDDEDDVRFRAGNREFRIEKSARVRVEASRSRTEVAVTSGRVSLRADDGSSVAIKKNETLTLDADDPGRYFLARGVDENSWDAWNKDRDRYHDQYARNSTQYVSAPYAFGFSDLSYYGNFTHLHGYGNVWRPYGVPIGWDPYGSGAWVWYPRYGYVWISSYPWGWTPYRYGRWLFVPAYGWVWQPGYWRGWHRTPRIYNPPPSYRRPVAPRHAGNQPPRNQTVWIGPPAPKPVFTGPRALNPVPTPVPRRDGPVVLPPFGSGPEADNPGGRTVRDGKPDHRLEGDGAVWSGPAAPNSQGREVDHAPRKPRNIPETAVPVITPEPPRSGPERGVSPLPPQPAPGAPVQVSPPPGVRPEPQRPRYEPQPRREPQPEPRRPQVEPQPRRESPQRAQPSWTPGSRPQPSPSMTPPGMGERRAPASVPPGGRSSSGRVPR